MADLLEDSDLTTNFVLDMRKKSENITECVKTLKSFGKSDAWKNCDNDSLRCKIQRVYQKVRGLERKKKSDTARKVLAEIFIPPQSPENDNIPEDKKEIVQMIKEKTKNVIYEHRKLKRHVEYLEENETEILSTLSIKEKEVAILQSLLHEITQRHWNLSCKGDVQKLEKENSQWQSRYKNVSERLDLANTKSQTLREELAKYKTRNINKKLKRREEKVAQVQKDVENEKQERQECAQKLEEYENEITCLKDKLENAKSEKIKLQKKMSYAKKCVEDIKCEKDIDQAESTGKIQELQDEIANQKNRVLELEDLNATLQSDTINTFEDGKFKNEIRETVMYLLTECNISVRKVNLVIETVLSKLAGKIPERLPSVGVKQRLLLEAKNVAACQVADAMLKNVDMTEMIGNCLHQDATSKFHHHYEGFQITSPAGETYSLGLKEVAGGDAQTYLEAFEQSIDDITLSVHGNNADKREELKTQLITSLMSTMSDQAAVNSVFNTLLSNLRKECINTNENFDGDDGYKEKLETMMNFSCRMHLLVNFASDANRILKVFENIVQKEKNPNSLNQEECTASRLVRTAAKAFTDRGSDKAGVSSYWSAYLSGTESETENKLETYRGHRVNILFYDAAAAYYHWQHMQDFLLKWKDPNKLLQSIEFDLNQISTAAGVRALGILFKVVMEPFWALLHAKGSILDLNSSLLELQICLGQWSKDATDLLDGQICFHNVKGQVKKDDMYASLFKECDAELETLTQMALELLCGQLLIMLERQAKDQLPGGRYWSLDDSTKSRVSHVRTTNIVSERDMSHVDRYVRTKPSASANYMETVIMWCENKPSKWLSDMDDDTRNKILDSARKNAPSLQKTFLERKDALKLKKVAKLVEKQREKEKKEDKTKAEIVKLTNEISKTGGVWLISEVDEKVGEILATDRGCAIIAQLHYLKTVLKANGPKELFQKSTKGHQYTVEELKRNLKVVLNSNSNIFETSEEQKGDGHIVTDSIKVQHHEEKQSLLRVLQDARNARSSKQQSADLPLYLCDPQNLVGKRIKHKVKEALGETAEWFEAEVLEISKKNKDTIKSEFDIKYDVEPDEIYTFKLLLDFKAGGVLLL